MAGTRHDVSGRAHTLQLLLLVVERLRARRDYTSGGKGMQEAMLVQDSAGWLRRSSSTANYGDGRGCGVSASRDDERQPELRPQQRKIGDVY